MVVTVLFVDLVDSTRRAAQMDPEDVRAVLEQYHDRVRREIESFGGVVEKFIGDAVMAVFGAPTAFGDDAERAVRAALAVRDGIADAAGSGSLRIAVNTGEALVSLDAHPATGEAMVAGDVVNTAARLATGAPPNTVIVGEETWRATRDVVHYEPAEPVDAKGKPEPLKAWIALRAAPQGERSLGSTFVGRTRELTLLRELWHRVSEDRAPHLVTVVGPAGAGKSRLAFEFANEIREQGGLVVRGRSLPYRESSAYGAFASHVKQLCRIFESDPPEVAGGEAPGDGGDAARRGCRRRGRQPSGDPRRPRSGCDGRRPRDALLLDPVLHRGRRREPAVGPDLRGPPLGRRRPARPRRAARLAAARPADPRARARRGPTCSTRGLGGEEGCPAT